MRVVLAVDFGSTFTKMTAIDTESRKIVGSSKAFTTIDKNVMNGYKAALAEIYAQCGKIELYKKVCCSSAAGGLKMVSSGLVPDLTAKASKLAAASAGAKNMKTYSYELTPKELDEIYEINPDIILLSGGIDGGNKDVIIKNARAVAGIDRQFAVIAAGNKCAADEVSEIMKSAQKQVIICENVMPEFNRLNIMPAKGAIRNLFIKNIINAKGLSEVQNEMDMEIIPTPLAVFNAAELLSKGTEKSEGFGELMVFDVGGATTDVYSMAEGEPKKPDVYLEGLKEPYAKRTVEGDIGVRYSLSTLEEEAGASKIAETAGVSEKETLEWIEKCKSDPSNVAEAGSAQSRIDDALAAHAIEISADRHAGYLEKIYTLMGEMFRQTGKDLTSVSYVIGTGGSVISSAEPERLLEKSCYSPKNPYCLKPVKPEFLLDKNYSFSAAGLLSAIDEECALYVMKNGFLKV